MKTSKYLIVKTALLSSLFVLAFMPGKAQLIQNGYMNVDWQFNTPLGKSFADKASGWGMNFESGYFITPAITLGSFISYHTNNRYIDRQTLDLGRYSAINTDQQHSLFQLPFGMSGRYNFMKESVFQPYVGLKMGANFARISTYYYVFRSYEDTWGFYMSPELGANIFPSPSNRFGFHVAVYYSYATNHDDLWIYSIDNLNNFGFRIGISF